MLQEPEQLDDGELAERTLQGDRAAFARLYDRYAHRVRAVVSRAADDGQTVDDLTQECFLRAYEKLGELNEPARFGPWLIGIARHVARERRRSLRRDRHRFVGADPAAHQAEAAGGPEGPDPEELALVTEQIRRLPESERSAIELFFLEGRDANKTAELLGMSRSGTYALLNRACQRLARSIQGEART